jgi:hypothetical protein
VLKRHQKNDRFFSFFFHFRQIKSLLDLNRRRRAFLLQVRSLPITDASAVAERRRRLCGPQIPVIKRDGAIKNFYA